MFILDELPLDKLTIPDIFLYRPFLPKLFALVPKYNKFKIFKMLKNFLPRDFYEKCLESQSRPDLRNFSEYRNVHLSSNSVSCAYGSSLVKLGHTIITCGIRAQVKPYNKSGEFTMKIDDYLDIQFHIPPMCRLQWKNNMTQTDFGQYVRQSLLDAVESSKVLLPEDVLVLDPGFAWKLSCDVVCLNDDGNVLDAAMICLMTALRTAKIPDLDQIERLNPAPEQESAMAVDGNDLESTNESGEATAKVTRLAPFITDSCPTKALNIRATPVKTSFVYFDNQLMVDPTSQEESLASGKLIVTLTEPDRIPLFYKTGDYPFSPEAEKLCLSIANKRFEDVIMKMKNLTMPQ